MIAATWELLQFALMVFVLKCVWDAMMQKVKEQAAVKEEMESWSISKLPAYAGVKDGTRLKELREYAYHLAENKQFEKAQ